MSNPKEVSCYPSETESRLRSELVGEGRIDSSWSKSRVTWAHRRWALDSHSCHRCFGGNHTCCCADANWGGEIDHHAEQGEPALVRHTAVQQVDRGMRKEKVHIHEEGPSGNCTEVVHAVQQVLEVVHGHHRASEALHRPGNNVHSGQGVHRVDQQ